MISVVLAIIRCAEDSAGELWTGMIVILGQDFCTMTGKIECWAFGKLGDGSGAYDLVQSIARQIGHKCGGSAKASASSGPIRTSTEQGFFLALHSFCQRAEIATHIVAFPSSRQ